MKPFIYALIIYVFLFFGIGAVSYVSAQEIEDQTTAVDIEPAEQVADDIVQNKQAEYTLPYPGILPDHPLYALKRLRDVILEFLIVDPIRKIEFHILQADKKLHMAIFLLEQEKDSLSGTTVIEAEEFLVKAGQKISELKESGIEVPLSVTDTMTRSLQKHKEVLEDMIKIGSQEAQGDIQQAIKLHEQMNGYNE